MLLRATAARRTVNWRRTRRSPSRSIFSASTSAPRDGRPAVNDLSGPERVAAGAIGQALPRKEDVRLLTGAGRFSDDFNLQGQAYAAMVRSPHPHARILGVDPTRRSEEHTSELQSPDHLVCRLLLEKKKNTKHAVTSHT